jgi:hypothetical protein
VDAVASMVATSAGEEKPEMGAAVHEEQSLHQKDLVLQVPSQVLNPKAESLCHEVAYLQRQVQEQNLLPEKAILLWALDSEQYHNPVQTVLVEELCREHPLVGLVLKPANLVSTVNMNSTAPQSNYIITRSLSAKRS